MDKNLVVEKKTFKMPHVFVILLIMMLFVTILTYVIPSGQYVREPDPITGMPIVVPDSFTFMEKTDPIGIIDFFSSIYTGIVEGSIIIASLLVCSGVLVFLQTTGTFDAGIHALLDRAKGKEFTLVIVFYSVFVLFGALGFGEGAYPFFPIITGVIMTLGYDRMTGAGVAIIGSTVGFASGLVNMFTTGISQQLVGLPLFSGMGFRIIGLIVFYIIGILFMYSYAKKIKNDPNKSINREEYLNQKPEREETEKVKFTPQRVTGLLAFVVLIFFQGYGAMNWKWGLAQITGVYVMFAIFIGILFKIGPSEISKRIIKGAEVVLGAALAIGIARSIMVILNGGNILDTFICYMSNILMGKGAIIRLLIIYLFVTFFNFFLASGSGKAVLIMPILSPLGKLLGINQQVLVLAYQYADGLTNNLWPGSAMVAVALCGIDYGDWLKYSVKVFVTMIIAGYLLVLIASKIGYGPF